ncbi:MAG: winged helix-turn-helix transcriptional regulator [Planctomycetes bacterium]|nr:winged helix-turn-helix transcriptional regulator [Planctomycetota bacterium]
MANSNVKLIPEQELRRAADCLRVMGHPTRLRIVNILMQGEFTVGEIADMCGLKSHHASEHLSLLKGRGLLDRERRGREVYYQIVSPRLTELLRSIRKTCEEND